MVDLVCKFLAMILKKVTYKQWNQPEKKTYASYKEYYRVLSIEGV
jgi:hypothetical protein